MSRLPQQTAAPSIEPAPAGLARLLANNDIAFAVGLGVVLATLLIPLPTFLLDMLLSCSIAVAIATLAVVLASNESIEFSSFPSLLLFVTLFRLSLNVASTRLILLQGDAGRIIATFGHFVMGGSVVVGLVVFLILVIIQFVVITKGAERISEVSARFNLDAMPGKQMAIDADLNAGLIGEEEARQRRQKIVRESEFYGAMDGASKFIRGDAIAGLIITAVNLIGGFAVGMTRGMTAGRAVDTYSILAVGDGLVTQIPAIIISTASGFLISKTSSQANVSQDLARQMLARSRPLWIAAFLLGAMVFVPNFPKTPFLVLALGTGLTARLLGRHERHVAAAAAAKKQPQTDAPVAELLDVDKASVQVGARLIRLVDPRREGSLSHRIGPLRRKFAEEYGLILPLVRLRDNVTLEPNTYEIRLHNHVVSTGRLEPEMYLAMDPGTVAEPIHGRQAREPVFNLPALWIAPDQKAEAERRGYTVVDPTSVLVTHLSESLKRHAYELLSRDDVQTLVDRLRQREPTLVNEVVGELVPIGLLQRVLQNLLRDGIGIRDLTQILEALGDHAGQTKDVNALTERTRKALVRTITERYSDPAGKVQAIVFAPALEYELCTALKAQGGQEALELAPERAMDLCRQVAAAWKEAMEAGHDRAVLLCDYRLRSPLAALLARQLPQLPVLAYDEVAVGTKVESVGTVPPTEPPPDGGTG
jgi:flagellar biosynthesis protein FlhA